MLQTLVQSGVQSAELRIRTADAILFDWRWNAACFSVIARNTPKAKNVPFEDVPRENSDCTNRRISCELGFKDNCLVNVEVSDWL